MYKRVKEERKEQAVKQKAQEAEIAKNSFGLGEVVVEEESSKCMIYQIIQDTILNNISTPEQANTPKRTTKLDPIERAERLA